MMKQGQAARLRKLDKTLGFRVTRAQKKKFEELCASEGLDQTEVLVALLAQWMKVRIPASEYEIIYPPKQKKDPLALPSHVPKEP